MISEQLGNRNPDDLNIPADQKKFIQKLLERLQNITLKIEDLDNREAKVEGNAEFSRDELRALNISRSVFVNEQKDIEKQISELLKTSLSSSDDGRSKTTADFSRTELKEEKSENIGRVLPRIEKPRREDIPILKKEKVKKPSFKFHVRSFKICPKCEARVPANFMICGRCGTKLQNFCPHCDTVVPEGVIFCGKCGKKIA